MGCTKYTRSIITCVDCDTELEIDHVLGASPVVKAELRGIKCRKCQSGKFKLLSTREI